MGGLGRRAEARNGVDGDRTDRREKYKRGKHRGPRCGSEVRRDLARERNLFELPFHIDNPLAVGACLVPLVAVLGYIRFALSKERSRVRRFLDAVLVRWTVNLPQEKKLSIARGYFMGMAVLFGLMSLFALAVASGLIKNKEPKSFNFEDIEKFERDMERQGLKRRSTPELEQLREKYLPPQKTESDAAEDANDAE